MREVILAKARADAAILFAFFRLDSQAKYSMAQLGSDKLQVLFNHSNRSAEYKRLYEAPYIKTFVGEWDELLVKEQEEAANTGDTNQQQI